MKYAVFAGDDIYEPRGGWNDVVGFAFTLEDAIKSAHREREFSFEGYRDKPQWAHIVNLGTGEIVWIMEDD